MESSFTVGNPTRRPGGRTADVTRRVNEAVLQLLAEGGVAACTFAHVAERAEVERSTLYRRYEDRWIMIMDATIASAANIISDSSGSFAGDLKAILTMGAETLSGPFGEVVLALAAALRGSNRESHMRRFWDNRMEQLAPMFGAAIARGELDPAVKPDELFAFAAGPLYFRTVISAQGIDEAWIDRIVENVCDRYCINRNEAGDSARGRTARGQARRRS